METLNALTGVAFVATLILVVIAVVKRVKNDEGGWGRWLKFAGISFAITIFIPLAQTASESYTNFFTVLGMVALFAGIFFVGKIINMAIRKESGKKRWAKFVAVAFTAFIVFPTIGFLTEPSSAKQARLEMEAIKQEKLVAKQKADEEKALAEKQELEQEKLAAKQKADEEKALAEEQKLEQEKLVANQKAPEIAQVDNRNDSGGLFSSIKNFFDDAKDSFSGKLASLTLQEQDNQSTPFRENVSEKIGSTKESVGEKLESVSEKVDTAKESVNNKIDEWQEERQQEAATENEPPNCEENKEAVKKYLEYMDPIGWAKEVRRQRGIILPLADNSAQGLLDYALTMKGFAEDAEFQFNGDERLMRVYPVCKEYFLSEAKIAQGYAALKAKGALGTALAINELTKIEEYKNAYIQQAEAKKQIKRFAKWSGANIVLP